MSSAKTLAIGILLATSATGLHAQAKPAAGATSAKPAASAKPAPKAAKLAGKPAVKTAAQPVAKPVDKKPTPVDKKSTKAAKPVEVASERGPQGEGQVAKRDPFESFLNRPKVTPNLPPGKAGLQVSTVRLDGIVRAPNGMIAVVSNPQARTYFLREGDQLYDGKVEKIAMDGVSFQELGKDAFGKPVERQVNKRLYSTAGEQQ
jgi:Tfp pilus assembly protein PilP